MTAEDRQGSYAKLTKSGSLFDWAFGQCLFFVWWTPFLTKAYLAP